MLHFGSLSGRDSCRTFRDVYKGCILLALLGVFLGAWRNTIAVLCIREWLVISDTACWVLVGIFELFVLLMFVSATVRRWQDLDIRIPLNESVWSLIQRARFWEVLANEEGSSEKNQYGPAPEDNPVPLLGPEDLKEQVKKKLFIDLDSVEEIK